MPVRSVSLHFKNMIWRSLGRIVSFLYCSRRTFLSNNDILFVFTLITTIQSLTWCLHVVYKSKESHCLWRYVVPFFYYISKLYLTSFHLFHLVLWFVKFSLLNLDEKAIKLIEEQTSIALEILWRMSSFWTQNQSNLRTKWWF